ncbi:MAG: hypothetical protein IT371_04670 [Deltaproteobacteria bacterium]|nr:hypothetical protein [Deltaproteobacteria bacterium]
MTRWAAAMLVACTAAAGCEAVVSSPHQVVASLHLIADGDQLGGLVATECVALHGAASCGANAYPNALGCDTMTVQIRASGETHIRCEAAGKVIREGLATVADSVPVICKASQDLSCQLCADIYGHTVVDTCNDRGSQLFRTAGGAWGGEAQSGIPGVGLGSEPLLPAGAVQTPSQTVEEPSTPVSPGCEPAAAGVLFAKKLNAVLKSEELQFSWSVPGGQAAASSKWGLEGSGGKDACTAWQESHGEYTQCWSNEPGHCHCTDQGAMVPAGQGKQTWFPAGKTVCKCARINIQAFREACAEIPPACTNRADWVAKLVTAYGQGTAWLFAKAKSDGGAKCVGSPLVLDLGNDGVAPTSIEQGVRFDLEGLGAQRTAWIKGDDALLVMDRNGNGRIDGGAELFGSGTLVHGVPAADGFQALAVLDLPAHGGNGNGLVEAGDLLFSELALWSDRNGDGQAQPGELRGLETAGVRALEIAPQSRAHRFDAHGNDLGLAARFHFADGRSAVLVDVMFRTDR